MLKTEGLEICHGKMAAAIKPNDFYYGDSIFVQLVWRWYMQNTAILSTFLFFSFQTLRNLNVSLCWVRIESAPEEWIQREIKCLCNAENYNKMYILHIVPIKAPLKKLNLWLTAPKGATPVN